MVPEQDRNFKFVGVMEWIVIIWVNVVFNLDFQNPALVLWFKINFPITRLTFLQDSFVSLNFHLVSVATICCRIFTIWNADYV